MDAAGESPPEVANPVAAAPAAPPVGVAPKAKMPVKMMMMKAAAAKAMASKLPSKLPPTAPAAGSEAAASSPDQPVAADAAAPANTSTAETGAVPPTAVPPKAKMPLKMMMMKAAAAKMMANKLPSKLPPTAPESAAAPAQTAPDATATDETASVAPVAAAEPVPAATNASTVVPRAPAKTIVKAKPPAPAAATPAAGPEPVKSPDAESTATTPAVGREQTSPPQPEATPEIIEDDAEPGQAGNPLGNPLGSANPLEPSAPNSGAPTKGKSKKGIGKSPALRPGKKPPQPAPTAEGGDAEKEKGGGGLFKNLVKKLVMPVAMFANAANSAANSVAKAVGLESSADKAARKKSEATESVKGTRDETTSSTGIPASLDGDDIPTGNAASDAASTVFASVTNDAASADAGEGPELVLRDSNKMSSGPPAPPVVFKGMTEIDYIAKIDFLENQLIRAETQIANLTTEGRRLKENLYEREGPRVAQHMMELERQVQQLTHQVKKERDGVEYHRTAHLQALDELTKMHHVFKENGDYKTCIEENMRLKNIVAELTQLKAEHIMMIDELEQRVMVIDTREGHFAALGGGKSPYVHVRRAALCEACRNAVEGQEDFLDRKLEWERGQSVMPIPPLLSQQWHKDPVSIMTQRASHRPIGDIFDHPRPVPGARGWRELVTPTGQVVFHNIITNQSTLQRPAELASSTR